MLEQGSERTGRPSGEFDDLRRDAIGAEEIGILHHLKQLVITWRNSGFDAREIEKVLEDTAQARHRAAHREGHTGRECSNRDDAARARRLRSEEHTSELQS